MPTDAKRLEFTPPPPPGLGKALVLALFAHALLLLALTWGISWKHEAENLAAEAELWSPQVQQAAPPPPVVAPVQPAPPPPIVAPPVASPPQRDADIALQQQKKREAVEKERREELEEKKKLAEQKKRDDLKKAEAARKLEAEKKAAQKERDEQQDRKAAEDRRKADATRLAKAQEEDKRLQAQREANLKRMQAMAGTGPESATGSAARSSGPSDSYAGRIRARVKPNIVFTDVISGNPRAEVEVRLAPDGTITRVTLLKSSGNKGWDDAVTRALDRTEVLPRDVDGRVHSPMVIVFSARD